MAATRLMALHINKGKTLAQCLQERTDYASNPEKTEKGELVTAYECDPMTVDEKFLLSKRQYQHITGRHQKNDVIAYPFDIRHPSAASFHVYVEYRKSGYSKRYFEEHREAVTLHKAAKNAFSQLRMEKLPRVKDLTAEYAQVLSEKKETYAEFHKARSEMQEYQKVLKNVEMFLQEQGVESVQEEEAAKKDAQRRIAEGKEKRHEES